MDNSKPEIISKILGDYSKSGDEFLFICPIEDCDSCGKQKLSVNFKKDKFKCWVCMFSGNSIDYIVSKFGTESQKNSWSFLDDDINIFEALEDPTPEETQIIKLPEDYTFIDKAEYHEPLKYLLSRGLSYEDIIFWRIGFSPSSKRVIFPSFDEDSKLNFYVARSYINSNIPYLNPKRKKEEFIFNEFMINWDKPIILLEGVFDAIKAGENAIPILGSYINENYLLFKKIVKNSTSVILGLDPDAEYKSRHISKLFSEYGVDVYEIDVLPYKDIGEMPKDEVRDRIENMQRSKDDLEYLKQRLEGL